MMLIPLGIQAKVFRIPWVTIFLAIALVVVSIYHFPQIEQSEKFFLRQQTQLPLIKARLALLTRFCKSEFKLSEKKCSLIEQLAKAEFINLADPAKELQKRAQDHGLKSSEANSLSKYIYSDEFIFKKQQNLQSDEFSIWQEARAAFDSERIQFNQDSGFLSKGSFSWAGLAKAQMIHGGWMHLMGNLLFFIFLSVFVELKMGSIFFLLMYTLSGSLGLVSQLLFSSDLSMPLMGASANISGVAGAFTIFFWRRKVNVYLNYLLFYNQKLKIPVYYFFPILVFAGDFAGFLSPVSAIAHLAHLSGFVVGTLCALSFIKLQNLPKDFLFEEEYERFVNCQQSDFTQYVEILKLNSENRFVHQKAVALLQRIPWAELSQQQMIYVSEYLLFHIDGNRENKTELQKIIVLMHSSWPLPKMFKNLSSQELTQLIHYYESVSEYYCVWILLNTLFQVQPKLLQNQFWMKKQNMYSQLIKNQEMQYGKAV